MRLLMMLLVLVGGCLRARAQAQTNASSQVRTLSLQDCIQMALRHNLDLQIDRYNPQIALFTLKAAYGAYDPVFSLSGQHDHTESGPVLFGTNFIGGSLSDDDRFSTSLKGTSPVGTTYSLAATPWPLWPMQLRTESSHEEGGIREWSVATTRFTGD